MNFHIFVCRESSHKCEACTTGCQCVWAIKYATGDCPIHGELRELREPGTPSNSSSVNCSTSQGNVTGGPREEMSLNRGPIQSFVVNQSALLSSPVEASNGTFTFQNYPSSHNLTGYSGQLGIHFQYKRILKYSAVRLIYAHLVYLRLESKIYLFPLLNTTIFLNLENEFGQLPLSNLDGSAQAGTYFGGYQSINGGLSLADRSFNTLSMNPFSQPLPHSSTGNPLENWFAISNMDFNDQIFNGYSTDI